MVQSGQSVVYFIQEGNDGPIKIGVSDNVQARLQKLQTAHAKRLRLLYTMPGTQQDERRMHYAFEALRIQNEWFAPEPELINWLVSRGALPSTPRLHWSVNAVFGCVVLIVISGLVLLLPDFISLILANWQLVCALFGMIPMFALMRGRQRGDLARATGLFAAQFFVAAALYHLALRYPTVAHFQGFVLAFAGIVAGLIAWHRVLQ